LDVLDLTLQRLLDPATTAPERNDKKGDKSACRQMEEQVQWLPLCHDEGQGLCFCWPCLRLDYGAYVASSLQSAGGARPFHLDRHAPIQAVVSGYAVSRRRSPLIKRNAQ